jgi:hypothetical protein
VKIGYSLLLAYLLPVTLMHKEISNQQVVVFNEATEHERKKKKERWRESYLNSRRIPKGPGINF